MLMALHLVSQDGQAYILLDQTYLACPVKIWVGGVVVIACLLLFESTIFFHSSIVTFCFSINNYSFVFQLLYHYYGVFIQLSYKSRS